MICCKTPACKAIIFCVPVIRCFCHVDIVMGCCVRVMGLRKADTATAQAEQLVLPDRSKWSEPCWLLGKR